jgi:serine/threonine protein kinase
MPSGVSVVGLNVSVPARSAARESDRKSLYAVFAVRSSRLSEPAGRDVVVWRRYTEFRALHAVLRARPAEAGEAARGAIPAPPPKRWLPFGLNDADFLDRRQCALRIWLRAVVVGAHDLTPRSVELLLEFCGLGAGGVAGAPELELALHTPVTAVLRDDSPHSDGESFEGSIRVAVGDESEERKERDKGEGEDKTGDSTTPSSRPRSLDSPPGGFLCSGSLSPPSALSARSCAESDGMCTSSCNSSQSSPVGLVSSLGHSASGTAPVAKTPPRRASTLGEARQHVQLSDFEVLRVVGKGSFGRVMLSRRRKTGKLYAIKVLDKAAIVKRKQIEHTKAERRVMERVAEHPYIVQLKFAFQSPTRLYLILEYVPGGELFFHLARLRLFPEAWVRVWAAELVLALGHLHLLGVVFRDLKPENVLLDAQGHCKLVDFGLCKDGIESYESGTSSFCGTPEYIAPEILERRPYGKAVDFWNLGMVVYEMLHGLPPFYSRNKRKLFFRLRCAPLVFPQDSPASFAAQDLIARLLNRTPADRLGCGPDNEAALHAHRFFHGIDWDKLYRREIPSGFVPTIDSDLDTRNFDKAFTSLAVADAHDDGDDDTDASSAATASPQRPAAAPPTANAAPPQPPPQPQPAAPHGDDHHGAGDDEAARERHEHDDDDDRSVCSACEREAALATCDHKPLKRYKDFAFPAPSSASAAKARPGARPALPGARPPAR